jgi:hypothetical protein
MMIKRKGWISAHQATRSKRDLSHGTAPIDLAYRRRMHSGGRSEGPILVLLQYTPTWAQILANIVCHDLYSSSLTKHEYCDWEIIIIVNPNT